MSEIKTTSIQLPSLSDDEAAHLLDVLYDLAQIVQAYYELRQPDTMPQDQSAPEQPLTADTATIDLFDDELPF